jgi:hypothetical protein
MEPIGASVDDYLTGDSLQITRARAGQNEPGAFVAAPFTAKTPVLDHKRAASAVEGARNLLAGEVPGYPQLVGDSQVQRHDMGLSFSD